MHYTIALFALWTLISGALADTRTVLLKEGWAVLSCTQAGALGLLQPCSHHTDFYATDAGTLKGGPENGDQFCMDPEGNDSSEPIKVTPLTSGGSCDGKKVSIRAGLASDAGDRHHHSSAHSIH
ncbi:hypothetical protein E5Q_05714 [Mixia osmundae IAM 14324]|uniref:Uncharacterized protein n=2 Tax=Mixia osmundae (strain CBS 9802 / IAM 14324 / JCM 22182 / KY 12970) TaxID=764103 RepID=G7E865_MIXOS|nr:hypothetical protein E5Q_05714 [Mixia osmundae IAM 14324]